MYCEKCGNKLNDGANFCPQCGAKQNLPTNCKNDNHYVTPQNEEFNRTVLNQYLYDVRSLECAKLKLNENLYSINNKFNRLCIPNNISEPSYGNYIEWEMAGYVAIFAVICAVIGCVANFLTEWLTGSNILIIIGFAVAAILIVGDLIYVMYANIKGNKMDSEKQENYKQALADEKQRMENETKEAEDLRTVYGEVYAEYEQVSELLEKAYFVNIIPQQFRNLYAVYYLYDYMSTSNEAFSAALLNCNLDEIKQKLDTVIAQQKEIIINQSVMIAQNEEIISQNNKTIRHLADVEKNTELSAQYAQVAAVNSEACAWIGVANYVSQNF